MSTKHWAEAQSLLGNLQERCRVLEAQLAATRVELDAVARAYLSMGEKLGDARIEIDRLNGLLENLGTKKGPPPSEGAG
jgi:hypothetical protein